MSARTAEPAHLIVAQPAGDYVAIDQAGTMIVVTKSSSGPAGAQARASLGVNTEIETSLRPIGANINSRRGSFLMSA